MLLDKSTIPTHYTTLHSIEFFIMTSMCRCSRFMHHRMHHHIHQHQSSLYRHIINNNISNRNNIKLFHALASHTFKQQHRSPVSLSTSSVATLSAHHRSLSHSVHHLQQSSSSSSSTHTRRQTDTYRFNSNRDKSQSVSSRGVGDDYR